jgi:predicted peptidase
MNMIKFSLKMVLLSVVFSVSFTDNNLNTGRGKTPVNYKYLLYLPDNYEYENNIPLLIYLHGASVRGNEISKIKAYGLPYLIEKGEKYDFIVVSPQCPPSKSWNTENWFEPLYNELLSKYKIDTNRIYLTGMSLGGYGAWNTAMEYPDKFAAVIPLCGGGNVRDVCNISHMPVWAFHGTADTLVPISETEKLVNQLKKCNGNVKFSRLEGKGHSIQWVYEDKEVYSWMLNQKKKPGKKK